jgi:hypothetical protein
MLPTLPHLTGHHPVPDKSFQFVTLPPTRALGCISVPLRWGANVYLEQWSLMDTHRLNSDTQLIYRR